MPTKAKTINMAGNDLVVRSLVVGKTTRASGEGNFDTSTYSGLRLIKVPAPQTATDTATLTVAQLFGGILQGTPTAAAAYTLPLVTDVIAALPGGVAANDGFDIIVVNLATNAAYDITMTTNTGWTLSGNMVVESNENDRASSEARFRARVTSSTAMTLYRIA